MASLIAEATSQRSVSGFRTNWLRTPQRVWLRRVLFQVHLWVGLALTLYAIVIGVSGSALVFREQIEHALRPGLYHLAPAARGVTLDQAVGKIQATRQGWKAFAIREHSVVGFWSAAALIAVSFTGLYFAFPAPVSHMGRLLLLRG